MSITNKTMRTPAGNVTVTKDSSDENYDVSRVNANTDAFADGISGLTDEIAKQTPLIGSYTPEFSWQSGATPPTVDNVQFRYIRVGHLLFVNGRFQITAVNAPSTATYLNLTLPAGINAASPGVGIAGWVLSTADTVKPFNIRAASSGNKISISWKATGGNTSTQLTEDYYNLFCFVPLSSAN